MSDRPIEVRQRMLCDGPTELANPTAQMQPEKLLFQQDDFLESFTLEAQLLFPQAELLHEIQFDTKVIERFEDCFIREDPRFAVKPLYFQNGIS